MRVNVAGVVHPEVSVVAGGEAGVTWERDVIPYGVPTKTTNTSIIVAHQALSLFTTAWDTFISQFIFIH